MALKQLMIARKLEQKRSLLGGVITAEKEIQTRESELAVAIEEATTDAEFTTVEDEANKIEKELQEKLTEKSTLESEIAELETELADLNDKVPSNNLKETEGGTRSMANRKQTRSAEEVLEYRDAVDKFIRTKGQERDGLVTTDTDILIPKDIQYIPEKEVETVADLSKFVKKIPVSASSGTYPMQKRAVAKMHTVAELQLNPDLAKPEFYPVDWKVDTYRGMIAISQESIDDSEADLLGIVDENANEQKVNTSNDLIAKIFKSFAAITIDADTENVVDKIKEVLNVKLDPGYTVSFVVTQSFYQILDTLKDKNGRYLLQDSITAGSPATLLNRPVYIVTDEQLQVNTGTKEVPVIEEQVAFIGDLSRAVLMPERSGIVAKWQDDKIYGQYLSAGARFGVTKADPKAGYFITIKGIPGA